MTSAGIEMPRELLERRTAKGLSLAQIATATKINLRYLEAIECGAFQKLPGGVYSESYIRQYARAVDDNDGALIEYYHSAFAPREAPRAAASEPERWKKRVRDAVHSILGLTPDEPLHASKRREA
jgi:cytoskeletal protein RodZ